MFNVKILCKHVYGPTHDKIHTISNTYDFILKYV